MRAKTLLRRTCLISALLCSASSAAADFRALDFDASCDEVAALESGRGSTKFEGMLPSGYQFAFRTRELDRDALAVYSCENGRFFRGAYIRTTSELGAPSYDFASQQHRKKMRDAGVTLSRIDTQVAFRNAKNFEAHASVAAPAKDRGLARQS